MLYIYTLKNIPIIPQAIFLSIARLIGVHPLGCTEVTNLASCRRARPPGPNPVMPADLNAKDAEVGKIMYPLDWFKGKF